MNKNLIFLIIILTTFVSYSKDEPKESISNVVNSLENYKFWGDIHNTLLQIAVDTYGENDTRVIGDDDAHPNFDEINLLQIQYANTLEMEEEYRPILCQALEEFKPYYDTDKLYEDYFMKKME